MYLAVSLLTLISIPEDVDRKWDNFKQDVEDVPEDIAYGVGDVVGDVDRFGDRMDNAYDGESGNLQTLIWD